MNVRRIYAFVSAAMVVIATAALFFFNSHNPEPKITYSLSEIIKGDIVSTVSATGALSPVITVQVGSQVSGTIQYLYADFNSQVKKGDLIAQIDSSLFKARLAEAEANLISAKAASDKAWVAVLDAKRQLGRVRGLQARNLVSESDVDAAKFAYETALVEHKVKQAAVAQAKAARDREKVNLAYTSIYAPINGIVISRDVDVGQTVAASLQAPTLYTIAQDLTRMQIETEVDEAFIGSIREDQPVSFTVFAYQDRVFIGKVAQVRLNPKVEAGVVKYNCIIYVNNADLALKPGMTATVAIEVARSNDSLKVPNSALRFVPQLPPEQLSQIRRKMSSEEGVIWIPTKNGLEPVKVTIGIVGEKESEILGKNLHEGMEVAVSPKREDQERKRRFGLSLF